MPAPAPPQASHLRTALAVGGLVTALALPRILDTGFASPLYLLATLLGMTLVAGAATAWGRAAGLPGLLPEPRRLLRGLSLGLLLGAALVPLQLQVDQALREALAGPEHAAELARALPPTARGRLASLLWGASLETLLFQGAAIPYFARLLRSRSVAVGASVLLRYVVIHRQLAAAHVASPLVVGGHLAQAAVAGALFAYAGLPAPAAFAAVLGLRLFL